MPNLITMAENIHDKFFKENFSRQDIAVDFVRELFPSTLLAKLQLDTFALTPNSYVEPSLTEYFADIVYECRTGESQPVQIAILFEHKSYREKYPHFQLLRYQLNSWEQAQKQNETPTLIIPIIIYHGKSRWQYEPLKSYFGVVDSEFIAYLPEFHYLLYDISHVPDERLLSFRNKFLATSLFLMKHREHEQQLLANRQALFTWLDNVLDTETGRNYLTTTVVYLSKNLDLRPKSFFENLFAPLNNGATVMSTYDQIIEEGVIKGREEAFRAVLRIAHQQGFDIALLARQYPDLPAERVQRIVDEIKKAK